jgi:predicted nucleic acid-binding protein
MLILDTNVLSTLMSPAPSSAVVDWLNAQPDESLFTTAITQAEILAGIALLPNGRRRQLLEHAAKAMFAEEFEDGVLPFDAEAAAVYADLYAERRKIGRSAAAFDLMIAAIARTRGASVVTRNIADFTGVGIAVINP